MGRIMKLTGTIASNIYNKEEFNTTGYTDVTDTFLSTYGIQNGYWTTSSSNRSTGSSGTAARFNSIDFVNFNDTDEYVIILPDTYVSSFRLLYTEYSSWRSASSTTRFRTNDFVNNGNINPNYLRLSDKNLRIWAFNIGVASGTFNLESALSAGFKIYKKD